MFFLGFHKHGRAEIVAFRGAKGDSLIERVYQIRWRLSLIGHPVIITPIFSNAANL
jgi:hypothetical protein